MGDIDDRGDLFLLEEFCLYRGLIVWDASRLDRCSRNHAELFRLRVWDAGTVESVREPMYGRDDLAGDVITSGVQRAAND